MRNDLPTTEDIKRVRKAYQKYKFKGFSTKRTRHEEGRCFKGECNIDGCEGKRKF